MMAQSKSKSKRYSPRREWVPKYEVKRRDVGDLIRVRDSYYQAIGYPFDPHNREQRNVIFRVAFAEAMFHYFTITSIAKALEKDHSSVSYYVKNSSLYDGYYDFYKILKEAATCIYHLEVGSTALGMRLKENIKQYVAELESS